MPLCLQWNIIAKEEGLGCIIFNREHEEIEEDERGKKCNTIVQTKIIIKLAGLIM